MTGHVLSLEEKEKKKKSTTKTVHLLPPHTTLVEKRYNDACKDTTKMVSLAFGSRILHHLKGADTIRVLMHNEYTLAVFFLNKKLFIQLENTKMPSIRVQMSLDTCFIFLIVSKCKIEFLLFMKRKKKH
jgi:hypothetical protein